MKYAIATFAIFVALVASASPIKLYCWVIGEDVGGFPRSSSTITNYVTAVNKIYTQVAMEFSIESISYTNNTRLAHVNYSNDVQIAELCGITNGTNGIELYFVKTITDDVLAFHIASGIVISENANEHTMAHEIGHACGLDDVYPYHRDTSLVVQGMPERSRLAGDWGWYPDHVTQSNVIERLMMCGYGSASKGDISRGDVYGVWYEYVPNSSGPGYNKVWHLSNAPVGFKLHGNRHPVSQ